LEEELRRGGIVPTVSPVGSLYRFQQIGFLADQMRRADLVHVHLFPAQYWVALASLQLPKSKRPVLVTSEHNTTNRRRTPVWHPADTFVYRRYHRIVAVSEAVAQTLGDWVPSVGKRIRVIHTAINVNRFANAIPASKRDVLGISDTIPVALCVGRLETQKNQATLLRALPHLPGFHVALVGDGVLRSDLEALAKTLAISDRVHFLGRRSDVPSLLKMADVYVQPSLWEGWSIAILEVMASAHTPIVASQAPGLQEAVQNHGWLFPIGDAKALARAVQTALSSPEQQAAYRAKCQETAVRHTIEACIDAHIALYNEALLP
jgi:glycosyltransferase involved in cell wall biosynthesis